MLSKLGTPFSYSLSRTAKENNDIIACFGKNCITHSKSKGNVWSDYNFELNLVEQVVENCSINWTKTNDSLIYDVRQKASDSMQCV